MSLLASRVAFAVWPPLTSLEESEEAPVSERQVSQRFENVVQKLEEREHQLARVLSDLEKHEKQLKELVEKNGTETRSPSPVKENQNGHRLP